MLSVGLRRLWEVFTITSNPRAHVLAQRNAELQAAVDRAYSLMNGSAYVGGPSEREAWQGAMATLGAVVTEHKGQP